MAPPHLREAGRRAYGGPNHASGDTPDLPTERTLPLPLTVRSLLATLGATAIAADAFRRALAFTLRWEGGYADHPKDPGGATCHGVTQAAYDARRRLCRLPTRPVREIDPQEVFDVYWQGYWKGAGCDELPPRLALAVFDTAVNFGPERAREFLGRVRRGSDLEMARQIVDLRLFYRDARVGRRPDQAAFLAGWRNRDRALGRAVAA